MDLTPSTTLAEIVSLRPDPTRELERLGLDYCCGSKRPLIKMGHGLWPFSRPICCWPCPGAITPN